MSLKVSIIIPVYNVQSYIARCLDSVVKQVYSNLEIIIIDDGSNDQSGDICNMYAEHDSRITVIHKKNEGVAVARNTGLDLATGDYIYFCDPDDWLEDTLIEESLLLAEGNQADMVLFGFYVHFSYNNQTDKISFPNILINSQAQLKELFYDIFLNSKYGNGFIWNKFYSKKFLDTHHFRFEKLTIQQDEVFNMKLYPKIKKIIVSNQSYYHYVEYKSGNASTRYIENKFDIINTIYKNFLYLYHDLAMNDQRYLTFVSQRFFRGVVNCLTVNLFHSNCKLTMANKEKVIAEIVTNANVIHYIKTYGKNGIQSLQSKILFLLIQYKSIKLLILYNRFYNFMYRAIKQ